MKKILYIILFGMLSSCSDFLTEASQDLSYVHSYTDLDEVLLGSGYMSFTASYFPYLHLMTDETQINTEHNNIPTDWSNSAEKYFGFATWQKDPTLSFNKLTSNDDQEPWNRIYTHLNTINMVLAEITKQPVQNDKDRTEVKRIQGEAHFLRAAYYFTLVNLYARPYDAKNAATSPAVPIKLSEYVEDLKFKRNSVKEVYDQILKDLDAAQGFLTGVAHKSIYRADLTATLIFRSRVYLYMCDYANAKKYAQAALNRNNHLTDLNNLTEIFLDDKSEELIFTMGGNQVTEIVNFNFRGFGVNPALLSEYTENDKRKSHFFTPYFLDEIGENITVIYKFKDPKMAKIIPVSDNFVIRTAEAYLNLAEAAACSGDNTTAQQTINNFRRNRYSSFSEETATGKNLINLIRHERRLEFCFEGHRWFDLRRYSVATQNPTVITLINKHHTFVYDYNTWLEKLDKTFVYEMKTDDPSNTLPIPKVIADFNEMTNNVRADRPYKNMIQH